MEQAIYSGILRRTGAIFWRDECTPSARERSTRLLDPFLVRPDPRRRGRRLGWVADVRPELAHSRDGSRNRAGRGLFRRSLGRQVLVFTLRRTLVVILGHVRRVRGGQVDFCADTGTWRTHFQ